MKTTMDYMIGNTAIQLVNTGKKIKIIDVEKQKERRSLLKALLVSSVIIGMFVASCFYVVRLENQRVLLDQSVYSLQCQIDDMQKENNVLRKEQQELAIDYDRIYKRALALGMRFPKSGQIGVYKPEKSTAIRIGDSVRDN